MVIIANLDSLDSKKSQKQRLIDNEEKAWEQHESLENAKTSVKQIEGLSVQVAGEINSQTNKMRDLQLKVDDMDEAINDSNSLMDRMLKRAYRNRMIIFLFISILVMSFLLIMYFKFN